MYATRDDLVQAYGAELVLRLSRRPEHPDGLEIVAGAIAHATAMIDAQLSVRFALPLASAPVVLREVAVDLAVSRLANSADGMTEELRRREERAEARLTKIAEGKMNLGLPAIGGAAAESPRPVIGRVQSSGSKLFTRDRTRGL